MTTIVSILDRHSRCTVRDAVYDAIRGMEYCHWNVLKVGGEGQNNLMVEIGPAADTTLRDVECMLRESQCPFHEHGNLAAHVSSIKGSRGDIIYPNRLLA